jgi:hypothetical protein
MSESLEHGLARLDRQLRHLAGLPPIAGGAIASAEFLLSRINDVVSDWSPGSGGGTADFLPETDNTYDLGSFPIQDQPGNAEKAWSRLFAHDIYVVGGGDTNIVDTSGVVVNRADASVGVPTTSAYFQAGALTWWNGAASVAGYAGVYIASRTSSPHTQIAFGLSDDSNDEQDVILDSARQFYPDVDNTGSLGIVGKTWGDIYATLPTSDPGGGGMWVNAANHNAVTIGSGA